MLERWITALHTEDAGVEEASATRERLKSRFPAGATRRMTRLGLLLGVTLEPLRPGLDDTLVYASSYGETGALEGYLDSFPNPSPTLFQTSIHPGSVQQNLILRQQPLRQLFPVTGGSGLPARALLVAFLADTPRVVLCGGEERGGWLLEQNRASDRNFAFSLTLSRKPENALARIRIIDTPPSPSSPSSPRDAAPPGSADDATALPVPLPLPAFFDHLHKRLAFDRVVSPGRRLTLDWTA